MVASSPRELGALIARGTARALKRDLQGEGAGGGGQTSPLGGRGRPGGQKSQGGGRGGTMASEVTGPVLIDWSTAETKPGVLMSSNPLLRPLLHRSGAIEDFTVAIDVEPRCGVNQGV